MSKKQRLLNSMAALAAHPKLVTFGISLAIGMAIALAIGGMFDIQQQQQHLAWAEGMRSSSSSGGGD